MELSVLLPYRDEEPFLRECLESLARQTLRDFELVAVNDGSRDGSPAIVEEMGRRFAAFRHLDAGGAGLVAALNLGLSRAQGEVIARADGDDVYPPRRLELQRDLIRKGVDAAGCRVRFFPRLGLRGGFRTYEAWINRLETPSALAAEVYVETPISHPSLCVRRSALERAGGYIECGWPEDFDLMIRLFQTGAVFGKVPRVLHFWREHPSRLCRSDPRYGLEAFIRCRCRRLAAGPLAGRKKVVIWGAGPVGKKTAGFLIEEGVALEAFVDIDPRKIGGRVRDRRVHGPSLLKRDRFFVLSCVGQRNARYVVKADLEALGYRERLDFILAG